MQEEIDSEYDDAFESANEHIGDTEDELGAHSAIEDLDSPLPAAGGSRSNVPCVEGDYVGSPCIACDVTSVAFCHRPVLQLEPVLSEPAPNWSHW